jgi:hypothetical protein
MRLVIAHAQDVPGYCTCARQLRIARLITYAIYTRLLRMRQTVSRMYCTKFKRILMESCRNPMCAVFPTEVSCSIPNIGAAGGQQVSRVGSR